MLFGAILTTLWGLAVLTGIVAVGVIAIATVINWAHQIFLQIIDAMIGFLYVVRHSSGATAEVYTQTYDERWMKTTRQLDESELPSELKNLNRNVRHRVADFD